MATPVLPAVAGRTTRVVVIGRHKYYSLFSVQLVEFPLSAEGSLKSGMQVLKPMDLVWSNSHPDELKFYLAVIKFQSLYEKSARDVESLKALVKNPVGYAFYAHDHNVSEKVNHRTVSAIKISLSEIKIVVVVNREHAHYAINCELSINGVRLPLPRVSIQYDYFVVSENRWHLCDDVHALNVLAYFKECGDALTLSYDAFKTFQHDVLAKMELHTTIEYPYLNKTVASTHVVEEVDDLEKIIYLMDQDTHVSINPVIRYGNTEIPVLSKKQLYTEDTDGNRIKIERNESVEDEFIALLLKQHPDFLEQLDDPLLYFYVNKKLFLDADWFLPAFEDWRKHNITILGFNTLKGNTLNPNKATINIIVNSGINWFNTKISVAFGKTKASLREIQRAVKRKSKFVQLDDGTQGIIPAEWIQKFSRYFEAGEILDEQTLQTSKMNYSHLSQLYTDAELDDEVRAEIQNYKAALSNVATLKPVHVPQSLTAQLRSYQLTGLNWLNILDEMRFGGCLADDMGLGKSIQIIAFMLLLREKRAPETHLLVAPTTLLYSWLDEFKKFAPSLNIHVHHGGSRAKQTNRFDSFDVILTSYGTLVSDINFLRKYTFGYAILDESQNIKNPSSQRYKAARLLHSRNRIILSGTPVENNTFDLYAQFSFACPGLLGNRRNFRDLYATSIDKFKNKRSLLTLQSKITPFMLRRTKQEVAKDLPKKTEMVLYCEMSEPQRAVYATYEKELRDFIESRNDDDLAKSTIHILKGLTQLRQICNSPSLVADDAFAEDHSTKIDVLLERIQMLSRHHKILVFSQFVSMLELIKTRLDAQQIPHAMLTGKTRNRDRVIDSFQNDASLRVFLISLKTGGTGLNLTAADYVFIVDPWWNPAVENQAIDRVYRIGQQNNVVAVRLICKDTVEEKMMLLQESKTKLSADLIDTDKNIFSMLNRNDFLALTDR